jgi:predicted O-methyltransferase YrrM
MRKSKQEITLKAFSFIRQGFEVFSFLKSLRKLDTASPEKLVDLALGNSPIRPLQDRAEFLELADLIAACELKSVLEIGTFRGGTLFVFARLSRSDATLISLDLPNSRFGVFSRKVQEPLFKTFTRGDQRLVLLRENSQAEETRSKVAIALKDPLDFIFIDGNHSYEGVKSDFEMYSPFLRQGGIVAFHDIVSLRRDYGVTRFWNEIKGSFKHREIINCQAASSMGIGVLWT